MHTKKLNIPVIQGSSDKIPSLNKTFFVGNDINDSECMDKVGFPVAVADAVEEIKKSSSIILCNNGGYGAVREFCEMIHNSYQND